MKSGSKAKERKRIARILRDLRVSKKLRQIDVADRLNEQQSYVSRYESGEARLDLVDLRGICDALGVRLIDLVRIVERTRDAG